jgi:hypothetical protein
MAGIMEMIEEIVKHVTIPRGQANRGNDYVSWRQDDGPKPRPWHSNQACFGGSMYNKVLTDHRFECRSHRRGRHLPPKVYLGSMRKLRQSGLLADGVRYWIQGRYARLEIPARKYDRHSIFAALSLYRHFDCHPHHIYLAWRLYQRLQDYKIPYLQCLHYALGILGYCGHTFISMGGYDGAKGATNPAYGWALAYFGTLPYPERAELLPVSNTTAMFAILASTVNPVYQSAHTYGNPNPTVGLLSDTGTGVPTFAATKPSHLLHPQLSPLYTNPCQYQTPEAFAELVAGVCQSHRPQKQKKSKTPGWVRKMVNI